MDLASPNRILWQAAVYFVVVLVIVAIISGVILLIWNDSWIASIRQCLSMESLRPESAFIYSPASALIRKMLCFISTTILPAFRDLMRATSASQGNGTPRSDQVLPRFRATEFEEPQLAIPHPVLLRDSRSFVPSHPNSMFELSRVPASWPPRAFPCSDSLL